VNCISDRITSIAGILLFPFKLLFLFLFLTQCAHSQPGSQPVRAVQSDTFEWQSPRFQTHPLTGRIWRASDRSFIDAAMLQQELAQAKYLLIGEKHDNPDHHRLRQQFLAQLRPDIALVSFEMLDHSSQAQLDLLMGVDAESTNIRESLDWDDAGWNWDFYGPLLSQLLQDRVAVRAANISSADVMEVYAGELNQIAAAVLTPTQVQELEQEIDASHCGMLPASQFAAMVRVQQARDYQMARSLLDELTEGELPPAGMRVLVAGNYHIRKDLGVPKYLQALDSAGDEVVTLAYLEVAEGVMEPQRLLELAYTADAFDYVWFTPAAVEQDYCAAFQ
jgi:uncharacterized iron-regulated protein